MAKVRLQGQEIDDFDSNESEEIPGLLILN